MGSWNPDAEVTPPHDVLGRPLSPSPKPGQKPKREYNPWFWSAFGIAVGLVIVTPVLYYFVGTEVPKTEWETYHIVAGNLTTFSVSPPNNGGRGTFTASWWSENCTVTIPIVYNGTAANVAGATYSCPVTTVHVDWFNDQSQTTVSRAFSGFSGNFTAMRDGVLSYNFVVTSSQNESIEVQFSYDAREPGWPPL